MTFTKTYADKCVTYYANEDKSVKLIVNNKTGRCKIKTNVNLFNIMGDTYEAASLEAALKLLK